MISIENRFECCVEPIAPDGKATAYDAFRERRADSVVASQRFVWAFQVFWHISPSCDTTLLVQQRQLVQLLPDGHLRRALFSLDPASVVELVLVWTHDGVASGLT